MDNTTDLKILKKYPHKFTWGRIIYIHEIGSYSIAEYEEIMNRKSTGKILYHIWVDGRDDSESCESLEAALATAIAHKFDGPNSQAGRFFARMIGR